MPGARERAGPRFARAIEPEVEGLRPREREHVVKDAVVVRKVDGRSHRHGKHPRLKRLVLLRERQLASAFEAPALSMRLGVHDRDRRRPPCARQRPHHAGHRHRRQRAPSPPSASAIDQSASSRARMRTICQPSRQNLWIKHPVEVMVLPAGVRPRSVRSCGTRRMPESPG